MNTSYGLDAYRTHDLNIAMKTSSGDTITMDFANKQELSLSHQENNNGTSDSFSFSSMESFKFSIDSNGIDAQDKKEIEAFMEIAQPFIDNFLEEINNDTPKSPANQIANQIAEIFQPMKQEDENTQNFTKSNIVKMFDNSMEQIQNINKIFDEAQKLLENTLKQFDNFGKNLYA